MWDISLILCIQKLIKFFAASVHSRAARRNLSSPPPDVPKTLTGSTTHTETTFLAPHLSGGISKKKSQHKPLRRKQRLRLEAEKEKAENFRGKTQSKLVESVGREETRKKRRRKWEEIEEGISKEIISRTSATSSGVKVNGQQIHTDVDGGGDADAKPQGTRDKEAVVMDHGGP